MQKLVITLVLCPIFSGLAFCQDVYYPYAAPSVFSYAGGSFADALNASFNPSLIPFIKNLQAACYAEKKYLTDLNVLFVTVSAPFNNDGISFAFQRYGNSLFNEHTITIAYGKKLGAINVGVIFQNIQVKIQDAGGVSLIKTGVATSIKVSDNFFVSCRINNPQMFAESGVRKLHCASSYSLAFGFEASSGVYTSMEMMKEEGQPLSTIFSLQYFLSDIFVCALNWNTLSNQPFASIGWQQKELIIKTGCSYHPTLGASPAFSVIYGKHSKK